MKTKRDIRLLAVASWGGHLEQLQQIVTPLLPQCDITLVTTSTLACTDGYNRTLVVPDFSRKQWWKFVPCFFKIRKLLKKHRITHIVSTGAAPGMVAIVAAYSSGIPSMWIDSAANTVRLSASGIIARHFATHTVSQWKDVAERYKNVEFIPNPIGAALENYREA